MKLRGDIRDAVKLLHDRFDLNGELVKLMKDRMSFMDYADRCTRLAGNLVDEDVADALDVLYEEAYRE